MNQYLAILEKLENEEELEEIENEEFLAPRGAGPLVLIFSLVFSFAATMLVISVLTFFCSRRVNFRNFIIFNIFSGIVQRLQSFQSLHDIARHSLYSVK